MKVERLYLTEGSGNTVKGYLRNGLLNKESGNMHRSKHLGKCPVVISPEDFKMETDKFDKFVNKDNGRTNEKQLLAMADEIIDKYRKCPEEEQPKAEEEPQGEEEKQKEEEKPKEMSILQQLEQAILALYGTYESELHTGKDKIRVPKPNSTATSKVATTKKPGPSGKTMVIGNVKESLLKEFRENNPASLASTINSATAKAFDTRIGNRMSHSLNKNTYRKKASKEPFVEVMSKIHGPQVGKSFDLYSPDFILKFIKSIGQLNLVDKNSPILRMMGNSQAAPKIFNGNQTLFARAYNISIKLLNYRGFVNKLKDPRSVVYNPDLYLKVQKPELRDALVRLEFNDEVPADSVSRAVTNGTYGALLANTGATNYELNKDTVANVAKRIKDYSDKELKALVDTVKAGRAKANPQNNLGQQQTQQQLVKK